ncbi:MAG TPA: PEP/pyruvate-binding domain-containing protein [Dehalococcoidia bacterium]|jgi:pyruvate,water dikinase
MTVIALLNELGKDDVGVAGGKGANLGELIRASVRVPPGFVVTADVYLGFLESSGIGGQIERLLSALDIKDGVALEGVAAEIKALITAVEMPPEVASGIPKAYREMGGGPVAVRSSATAEDLAEASFAGQQDTYLNIEGDGEVIAAVQKCWASLFGARAISYRAGTGFDHMKVGIAVVVQRMVQSERAGVMFTVHPVTNDDTKIVIEALYGLGEAVVSGLVTPDMYVVDKTSGAVVDRQVVPQEQEFIRRHQGQSGEEQNHWRDVDLGRRAKQKLSDEEIGELATIGQRLEQHFGCPQDIEWAHENGLLYIVQARAVTTASWRWPSPVIAEP